MDNEIWAKAVAFGLLASGLVLGAVEGVKAALGPEFPPRFVPIISMTIAGVAGLGVGYLIGVESQVGILGGLLAGTGANLAYAYGKSREAASGRFQ